MSAAADIDTWYRRYHAEVNMTLSELRRWADSPCSHLASLDRSPIERNVHLLSTPRVAWGKREVAWAKKTVSFIRRMRGVRAGRQAAAGCPSRRDIALKNWAYDPHKTKPNRGRPRVYDAEQLAVGMRERFADRPVEERTTLRGGWPTLMQNVGDSLAVAYGSDKWEEPDGRGRRKIELYKHLAESRNRVLVVPGLLRDEDDPDEAWEVIGPRVSLGSAPMPQHFAVLGLFEECHLKLYTDGTNDAPRFGRGTDAGIVRVEVRHGMLGASAVRWNEVSPYRENRARWFRDNPGYDPHADGPQPPDYDEPFLFVYTESGGVMMIIVGAELGIEHDGIVG